MDKLIGQEAGAPGAAAVDHHADVLARLDLVEDLLSQRRQVGGDVFGEGVLGVEVVDDLLVGLVTEPLVRVDEDIAVMFAAGVDPFGDGWLHAFPPIQSSKRRPEIRSYASM